ncbi:MAG: twin-arginine translocase TatA/TatE family subunit [Dehalococcoidia bacterium]|jgi:sec-independent protein translocase protein TatA|nr:twin-arginine translocase TatA/TatE family subunit [Dehalococcoidia bacterium]MDW8008948.1 twin-arginine translocase TatA/TatE family subunit [Chloroflexota bacterium]
MPFLLFQGLGPTELLIIFAIIVVLFGASRIADIGGAIGRAIREFRREIREPDDQRPKVQDRERRQVPGPEARREDRPDFRH